MFRHVGTERTPGENRFLAAYLASVAGYVNVTGVILLGVFTSHATGNIARVVADWSSFRLAAGGTALLLVVAFFLGAFAASVVIEAGSRARTSHTYGLLLLAEASLLVAFALSDAASPSAGPRLTEVKASLLCFGMGLQNSLVTRLSGAVVRTTHLTGVLTDLAIEAARWFRFARGRLSGRWHVRLSFGDRPIERPQGDKTALLLTLLGAFVVGGFFGGLVSAHTRVFVFVPPIVGTLVGGAYGLLGGRALRLERTDGDDGGDEEEPSEARDRGRSDDAGDDASPEG
jgi:uncharacterized membrane protein YoaK (UPF0700 family)